MFARNRPWPPAGLCSTPEPLSPLFLWASIPGSALLIQRDIGDALPGKKLRGWVETIIVPETYARGR